ncbi:MAG: SMC family ATPase [Abditibacteriales bacterium]|nr:SMC family ATPase [Abditibacteriales bacterium]MDW8367150.1 SMC family ATPase [Abditibacteriales bacterium]
MVPIKLSLKNFLSYADENPPLDFTQFHVACLSGNNGHGKSALLDAITWALWGKARSRNEDLLRLGAQEMEVELEFTLEGNRYRVLRRFRKTARSGTHRLEFQLFDPTQDRYLPLTQPGLTQTEERIKQTLRMDYATFINSAFILQGRADEFTRKSARERKEILSEILGLSRYDAMAERARLHARRLSQDIEVKEARLQEIEAELQHREAYETRLAELREQVTQVEAELHTVEEELARRHEERVSLLQKKQQAEELSKRLQEAERDLLSLTAQVARQEQLVQQLQQVLAEKDGILADFERYQALRQQEEEFTQKLQQLQALSEQRRRLELAIERERAQVEQERTRVQAQLEQTQKAIAEADAVLQKAAEIEAGYERLQAARREEEAWERQRMQYEKLEAQRRELEREIEKARNAIQVQLDTCKRQGLELKRKADALPSRERERAEAEAVVKALTELTAQHKVARDAIAECTAQLAELKAQKDAAEKELATLRQRREMIRFQPEGGAGIPVSPRCPVCRQPLDEKHQQDLEHTMAQEEEDLQKRIQTILNDGRKVKRQREELDKQVKEWEERLRQLPAAQQKLADAIAAERDAQQSAESLKEIMGEVQALTERLDKKDFAPQEHKQLAQVVADLAGVRYDAAQHKAARDTVAALQRFEVERGKLESVRERRNQAAESLPTLKASLKRLDEILERKAYSLDAQRELLEIQRAIASLNYSESAHHAAQEELRRLSAAPIRKERLDNAEKQIGTAEQYLRQQQQSLADKVARRAATERERAQLMEELAMLALVEQRLSEVTESATRLRSERDRLLREQAVAQASCLRLESLAQEKTAEEERLEKLKHERFLYDKLEGAFGRDGIPALIIENAIPEIEEEANRLLRQLTDNRVQVAIEPLRDLKSGGIKETLDIKVSDELGTRPLELFSGGESFRVDFALRIALSKLLARRAGTRLRTLVVDEGFGTQDADGLQRILEAINVIKDDFDKILVITHLETLKNAFPARIEVVKLPDVGSRYELVV